ncbi:MAG: SpoIIE family protein phosphatase [Bacteroidales bacterium]|jgi:hypothetical protein|nr:SpoIIE family protein phosphatase [Bacteroidales bacterium]
MADYSIKKDNADVIEPKYHVEVGHYQCNYEEEKICGDVFLSKRIADENRVLCVLSDGMGHGVRANILATLTATISLNFSLEHKDVNALSGIIMKALPVNSENGLSYATYTIIDISIENDTAFILEYDNPQTLIVRGAQIYEPQWNHVMHEESVADKRVMNLKTCTFTPQFGDRIIFCSDGIVQSGLGKGITNGWGRNNMIKYVRDMIEDIPDIAANDLAEKVVKRAIANDLQAPKDDFTCGVIYFRMPRKMLLCTGPPFTMDKDCEFAKIVKEFDGKKIISGATTTEIVSRELHREVIDNEITDPTLPPSSKMSGVDLVTEGVLTLGKVIHLLNNIVMDSKAMTMLGKGPADQICQLLLESDEIYVLVGTKINESHHDPSLPVEIEIRKHLIQRLTTVLSDKFMKVVKIKYM